MSRTSTLLAAALALCLGLTACSKDSDPSRGPDATRTSTDSSATTTPNEDPAGADPVGTDAEPIMVGDNRHRPACQLFPPTEAVETLPLKGEADFTEVALTQSVPLADRPPSAAVDQSMARTSCSYNLGDAKNTTVQLTVEEYADEQTAHSEWATVRRFGEKQLPPRLRNGGRVDFHELDAALRAILKDAKRSVGGVRVPGFDDRLLWRTGTSEFVATVDNLMLTFDRGETYGLEPKLTKRDAALAERVLLRAIDHAEDPETPTTSVPAFFAQDADWPLFLNPCELLDGEAGEVLLGEPTTVATVRSVDLRPAVNLRGDSPAGRSHDNSCERQVSGGGSARLNVQYVAPNDTAEAVLYSHISHVVFGDPTPSRKRIDQIRNAMLPGALSDVDASYLLSLAGNSASSYSYRYYLLVDRYVLELSALMPRGRSNLRSVDTATLRDGADLVAANLSATLSGSSAN